MQQSIDTNSFKLIKWSDDPNRLKEQLTQFAWQLSLWCAAINQAFANPSAIGALLNGTGLVNSVATVSGNGSTSVAISTVVPLNIQFSASLGPSRFTQTNITTITCSSPSLVLAGWFPASSLSTMYLDISGFMPSEPSTGVGQRLTTSAYFAAGVGIQFRVFQATSSPFTSTAGMVGGYIIAL